MPIELVFETHATTEDNERGIATGWLPGRLSADGREQARALGRRRVHDEVAIVFTSDLARAVETVGIAFGEPDVPVLHDWRLRECNYGALNGAPVAALAREDHHEVPYPGGESWADAVRRVGRFLADLESGWPSHRVLVVGHTATRWAFDHLLDGAPLPSLLREPFAWRPGWEYRIG